MPELVKGQHKTKRTGWLRAAVLGANDGILSTASLVLGVASAHRNRGNVLVAGVAGLVAGAMSMAAGEYVSVHSQADTEKADLDLERQEIESDKVGELKELADIYVSRGLDPALAKQVAEQLMTHDAVGAHARDELGITETLSARPLQAALASGASFAIGGAMPILVTALTPGILADSLGVRYLVDFSSGSGRTGGPRRRSGRRNRSHPGDVLGRAGHGFDRRRRCAIWNRDVTG